MGSFTRQKEYLLSHALARLKIAEVLKMPPADVPLLFEDNTKPSPIPGSLVPGHGSLVTGPWHLSLSHTHLLIACALAPCPVGVDVEPVGRTKHIDDVARRMFHPTEADEVCALIGDEKKLRFTQYWVLREAFYKASGMPLTDMIKGIVFNIDDDEKVQFTINHQPSTIPWQFSLTSPLPDHIMALAVQGPLSHTIKDIQLTEIV